ncbi:MAG: hypothetical protein HYZ42_04370, partial [Bacteroidetes bacterium]|nr:hypothetical protein [Bacteroidota bacterium]
MRFCHLSSKEGLTDDVVTCFLEDHQHKMWMGTGYGLNCFDGSEIHQYHNDTGSFALPSDDIRAIVEDSYSTIWIGTNKGLCSYNPKTSVVTNYLRLYTSTLSKDIQTLSVVGSNIWIGTTKGLQMFDSKTFKFIEYTNNQGSGSELWQNNDINHIYVDKQQHIWLSTYNGLWQFDQVNKKFIVKDSKNNDPDFDGLVLKAEEDSVGNIWFGTWSKGIKKYIPHLNKVECYSKLSSSPTCANDFAWQRLDGQTKLWITKDLTVFDPITKQFKTCINELPVTISYQGVQKLYSDNQGLLWIATQNGVYIYNPFRSFFKHMNLGKVPITSQEVVLFPQKDGIIIGGQDRSALVKFDNALVIISNLSEIVNFTYKGVNHHPSVLNITTDKDNHEQWVCTSEGLLQLDEAFKTTKHIYIHDDKVEGSLPRDFINHVYITLDNKILVFPWRKGVWEMNRTTHLCYPFKPTLSSNAHIQKTNIVKALEDHFGHIWLANIDGGLLCYESVEQRFHEIVGGVRVSNMQIEGRFLWVVSDKLIYRVDCGTKEIKQWSIPIGLNKYIYDFVPDDSGHLWIASKSGLLVFYINDGHFRTYTSADGLRADNMNGRLCRLNNGNMLFASDKYCTLFSPKMVNIHFQLPQLLLTDVEVNHQSIDKNQLLIEQPYDAKTFLFKWALPDYQVPLQSHYYCMLEGVDPSWKYTGNKGSIEYFSLQPGTYIFKYKASTSDGIFSNVHQIKLRIYPPFWKTWWFVLIVLLSVLAIIYIIFRNRIESIQRKADLQNQLKDIEMKALRA